MYKVTSDSKKKTLAYSKAIANRKGISAPVETDIFTEDENFSILLDIENLDNLPIGLVNVCKQV